MSTSKLSKFEPIMKELIIKIVENSYYLLIDLVLWPFSCLFFTELAKLFLTLCTNPCVCTGLEFPVKLRVMIWSVIWRIEGGGGDMTILGRAPVLTGVITVGAIWLVARTGVCKEVTVVVVPDITV